MFIKTGTKHASKDGIELAVFKAFGEVLIEALSFRFGVAELVLVCPLIVLLVDGFSLVHTVIYDAYCRGVANHSRVAECTHLSPEGEYSGVS